jgi:hypothetical protein
MIDWTFSGSSLGSIVQQETSNVLIQRAGICLSITFSFVISAVLLNLLISLMTASLEQLNANNQVRSLTSKAIAIDEIDATVPRFLLARLGLLDTSAKQRYLHVLRVDPDNLDNSSFWPYSAEGVVKKDERSERSSGRDDETLLSAVSELTREIKELRTALKDLGSLGIHSKEPLPVSTG